MTLQTFVVAVEYRGADIVPGGAARVPVCEHAYELYTAALAGHPSGQVPRIAFPDRLRGWNTAPETRRCAACDDAVTAIVREVVTAVLAVAVDGHRPS